MSRGFRITLVVLALILEITFLPVFHKPFHRGVAGNDGYRRRERFAALADYKDRPSAETKAAFEREMALMVRHDDRQWYLALGLLIVANGTAIYYLLRREDRTPAA